jgi:hypothetical protein
LSNSALNDLLVWAGFLTSDLKWFPICALKNAPPMRCLTFISDAAGLSENCFEKNFPGCGAIGLSEEGLLVFARQILWPSEFIISATDEKGIRFGDKSCCLEVIGVILPFTYIRSHFM